MRERRELKAEEVPLSGIHLIEASAGTGKTYTITSLVLRMLTEAPSASAQADTPGLAIDRLVAVTFTKAATAELKQRIQQRIFLAARAARAAKGRSAKPAPVEQASAEEGDGITLGDAARPSKTGDAIVDHLLQLPDQARVLAQLERAERDADNVAVFTIHGFATRMLTQYAFECGVRDDVELSGDEKGLLFDVVADFWARKVAVLSLHEFDLVGGAGLFSALVSIGRKVASAFDIPVTPQVERPELLLPLQALNQQFIATQRVFQSTWPELKKQLYEYDGLNRTSYSVAILDRELPLLEDYFSGELPTHAYPDAADGRFTQSRVTDKKIATLPALAHPLLQALEDYRNAHEKLQASGQQLERALRGELAKEVRERVAEEHERLRTRSFDGLLSELCLALRDGEAGQRLARAVGERFRVALIDEFQDTDPIQYEIFATLFPKTLYMIGDPKQSIYAFRGADVHTYLQAGDASDAEVWTLRTNYRSSPNVVAAQNVFFEGPALPFGLKKIPYERVGCRPQAKNLLTTADGEPLPGMSIVRHAGAAGSVFETVVEIRRFLEAGHVLDGAPVTPGNIAVLTRSNGDAAGIQAALLNAGIPAVLHGDRSVLETDEALELRRVLRAVAEPNRRVLVRTALATRWLGVTSSDLLRLEEDPQRLEYWVALFRETATVWREQGISQALHGLARDADLFARNLRDLDGERRVTNFRHLLELLHEAETTQHLGMLGVMRWLEMAMTGDDPDVTAAESQQVRLESDDAAVVVMTAHKSKGLEFDVVFLPSIGKGMGQPVNAPYRFHDADGSTMLQLWDDDPSRAVARIESAQEGLRVAYVALTRAKHHMVIVDKGKRRKQERLSALNYFVRGASGATAEGMLAVEADLKALSDEDMQRNFNELVSRSSGVIALTEFEPEAEVVRWGGSFSATDASWLEEPYAPIVPKSGRRTSSFSGMTRHVSVGGHASRAQREGRDRDEADAQSLLDGEGDAAAKSETETVVLEAFPRGARAGDALHAVFENSPFAEGTSEARGAVVSKLLKGRGMKDAWIAAAAIAVEDVLSSPLTDEGLTLGSLDADARFPEMEFSLPVGDEKRLLSADSLAAALRAGLGKKAPWLSEEYVEAVKNLDFSAFRGFLRGFMDLVFVADGKLWVLDYKSNYLGPTYADYGLSAMQEAMESHHYLLQGLLYAVAVHRHGQRRIADYDYETHFGGALYLYLRGMRPGATPGGQRTGVYGFRPERRLIERLSLALERGEE